MIFKTFVLFIEACSCFRMRRKLVSWSCLNLRSAIMQLFTLKNMMRSFSPTCLASSQPSGTCWSPRAKKSNMIWWVTVLDDSACVLRVWLLWWMFSWVLLFVLSACEQCHPVPGIGVWEATLQASVWRSEHTHQHLRKGHRPQHGIQKYVRCIDVCSIWGYFGLLPLRVISLFLMICDQVRMKKHLKTIQRSIL